jgi:hypothetical protein
MPKMVALTVRKLKPGAYDDWREAWGSADGPPGAQAWIARKINDPNEIVAFGIIDASMEELEKYRPSSEDEQARLSKMAPHIESVESDGLYEVIDEISW